MKSADFEKTLNQQLNMFPQILVDLFQNLADEWAITDIEKRDRMVADHETMDPQSFDHKWGKSYGFRTTSNKAFKQRAATTAERYIAAIYNKIVEIGGKIIDMAKLIVNGVRISGSVKCERGIVIVESVMVGLDRMMNHNVRIHLEDPQPEPTQDPQEPECKDLNYWMDQLELAIDIGNTSAMIRAKQAIKEIKKLIKKGN